jgi:hypothetical protein
MTIDIEDFEFALDKRFRHVLQNMEGTLPRTPREMAADLAADLPHVDSRVSVTARAFFRIRGWASTALDINPRSITPNTRWADLIPDRAARRRVWTDLRNTLNIREFSRLWLGRPSVIAWLIAIVTGAVGLGTFLMVATMTSVGSLFFLAGAGAAIITLWLLLRLTRRWAVEFRPANLTVGDVACHAVAYGSPILGEVTRPLNREQTLEVVQALAIVEIGSRRAHPDATWEELSKANELRHS